jgi:hypothetical protein
MPKKRRVEAPAAGLQSLPTDVLTLVTGLLQFPERERLNATHSCLSEPCTHVQRSTHVYVAFSPSLNDDRCPDGTTMTRCEDGTLCCTTRTAAELVRAVVRTTDEGRAMPWFKKAVRKLTATTNGWSSLESEPHQRLLKWIVANTKDDDELNSCLRSLITATGFDVCTWIETGAVNRFSAHTWEVAHDKTPSAVLEMLEFREVDLGHAWESVKDCIPTHDLPHVLKEYACQLTPDQLVWFYERDEFLWDGLDGAVEEYENHKDFVDDLSDGLVNYVRVRTGIHEGAKVWELITRHVPIRGRKKLRSAIRVHISACREPMSVAVWSILQTYLGRTKYAKEILSYLGQVSVGPTGLGFLATAIASCLGSSRVRESLGMGRRNTLRNAIVNQTPDIIRKLVKYAGANVVRADLAGISRLQWGGFSRRLEALFDERKLNTFWSRPLQTRQFL